METDFIYWRHDTPTGIRVEEVSGAEDRKGRVWLLMARQVYAENGGEVYRVIDHFPSGAPYLEGSQARISVGHTDGMLVVASLPRTPEADLGSFSPRSALGVDVERADREQAVRVRERFLHPDELPMVPSDDLAANVLAWTCKEAMLKAGMDSSVDIREALRILTLPDPSTGAVGHGRITLPDGRTEDLELYSYPSEGFIVTLAYSPKCAKFKKS